MLLYILAGMSLPLLPVWQPPVGSLMSQLFFPCYLTWQDHNEPTLDALQQDLLYYADLRSFQLQLNRHFLFYRLPLGGSRGGSHHSGRRAFGLMNGSSSSSGGSSSRVRAAAAAATMSRRWYVGIYNFNMNKLGEAVKFKVNVKFWDLSGRNPVFFCPFDCSGNGKCVDPLSASLAQLNPSVLNPLAQNPSLMTAVGPLQDRSPVEAGFMCQCNQGFGGMLCEGRLQAVTVGSGEQKLGPEQLQPGQWFYYLLTLDPSFNSQSNDLGIQWTVGLPSSPPSTYPSAFISFDQGPMPRWVFCHLLRGWRVLCSQGNTLPRHNPRTAVRPLCYVASRQQIAPPAVPATSRQPAVSHHCVITASLLIYCCRRCHCRCCCCCHRPPMSDRRFLPIGKKLAPYSRLIVNNNPPLPLQVKLQQQQQQQ
jgi:hypothetical protein